MLALSGHLASRLEYFEHEPQENFDSKLICG
jgi:hypothetical protein